ncbi:MAG: pentapeptide repeat-containing protein [Pleurocapsa sp. MO_226.B13]|nr:pentapeptide repeat-containing protein [Pleurocapsa sp. MO_226.B13]
MANEEHLAVLRQGVSAWNQWRKKNPEIRIDLREADLRGVSLRLADLREADLRGVSLRLADLREADLNGANLRWTDCSDADLSGANLKEAQITQETVIDEKWRLVWEIINQGAANRNLRRADLSRAYLSRADFSQANLTGANLTEADLFSANLEGADFRGANLFSANLEGADFRGANLGRTQALGTNFNGATFTGACLENWNINSETNLDNVICDYVYLKENQQERRPASGNFAPGEFTTLFQKALETVDLIFSDGIDWQAFLISFQNLQVECGSSELAIQAIERKSGGAFVVRVEVPADANKAEVEQYLKREYEIQLKAIEDNYRLELNAKDREIEIYKQNSANIMKMAELVAKVSNPTIVNVEAKAVAESQSKGDTYNQSGNIGIGHMSGGEIQKGAKVAGVINEAEQQNLAQAAAEIQQLLEQLSQTYPTNTTAEKMMVAVEAIKRIENDPTWKQRVINAAKEGGLAALEKALDNPVGVLITGAIKGWLEAKAE